MIEVVSSGWKERISRAFEECRGDILLVSPFIKKGVIESLLSLGSKQRIRVITRFNLQDMYNGASELEALSLLHEHGVEVRGVRDLHSKVYIFGSQSAFVTSANLTHGGLSKNHEFGVTLTGPLEVRDCIGYFNELWSSTKLRLTQQKLNSWKKDLSEAEKKRPASDPSRALGDFGGEVPKAKHRQTTTKGVSGRNSTPAFIKIWGTSKKDNRSCLSTPIKKEVEDSESYFACAYPNTKRPKSVEDGSVIFMGRLTKEPNDIIIYGRAIGSRHTDSDFASASAIKRRPFKETWGAYVRVHNPEFINGTLERGISLNALKEELGHQLFQSTTANAERSNGNLDPSKAYSQQAQVRLSEKGLKVLTQRFNAAIKQNGLLASSLWDALPRN